MNVNWNAFWIFHISPGKYDLSSDFRIRDVTSSFSSDGVLTIKAYPVIPAPALAYYRDVPVYQTFRPSYLN